jgi:hypothetical protein
MEAYISEVGRWWRHTPWSSAHAHHKPNLSQLISACSHLIIITIIIIREWLDGFSWNLIWKLCHWPLQTCFPFSFTQQSQYDGCLKSWGGMMTTLLSMILCASLSDDVINRDIRLYAFFILTKRMAGRISMKFGVGLMPLHISPDSYLLISCNWYYQRDECTKSCGGTMMTSLPVIICACASLASPYLTTPLHNW